MRYGAFSPVAHVWLPCAAFGHCLPRSVALWREPGLRGRCGVLHHGRSLRGAARGCAGALVTRLLYTSTTSTTTEQTPASLCLWKWYVLCLFGVCCLYAPALPTCWFSPLSLCVRGPNLDSFLSPSVRENAGPGTLAHCPVVASWEQCGASSVFAEVVWFKYVFPVLNSLSTLGSSARFVIPRVRGAQCSVCMRQLGGLRNSRSRWLLQLVRSSRGRDATSSSSSTLTPPCSCHMCGLRSYNDTHNARQFSSYRRAAPAVARQGRNRPSPHGTSTLLRVSVFGSYLPGMPSDYQIRESSPAGATACATCLPGMFNDHEMPECATCQPDYSSTFLE